jgi:small GTP-binding protein
MSAIKDDLFKGLFSNFLKLDENLVALIVSDQDGFIIAGEKREDIDIELISVITTLINPIMERIRNEFEFKKFGNATILVEKFQLLFISIDESITLTIVFDLMASVDNLSPYAYFLAEKVAQIINAQEGDKIQIIIPNFEMEADVSDTSTRIKDQIYQMRLDSGGKYRFKFVILGDHQVGKTSIIRRFVENKFNTDYRATIGLNILTHSIEFYGNQVVLSLFDIGAQEFFKRFRKTYYAGAQAGFIVFDLTNKVSFENVDIWFEELKKFIGNRLIPFVIVGNKLDLSRERQISYDQAVKLVSRLSAYHFEGGISYIETSALTGENVHDAFNLIAYHFIMRSKELEEVRLRKNLMDLLNSILEVRKKLTISFITQNPYWSPGLQILNGINALCECDKLVDDKERRVYEYSNGLKINNFLFDNVDVKNSDAVFVIFDARNRYKVDYRWKDVIHKIIQGLSQDNVAMIGIRVSEDTNYEKLMEEFDINSYLEQNMVSMLFFKIGSEYRLEIYDQLEIMFNTILSLK